MTIKNLRRAASQSRTISSSGLFDVDWYISRGGNRFWPSLDYCLKGVNGDVSCCYLFDEKWYLQQYPDVRKKGILPLIHYIECGEHEGRSPSPLFDARHYRSQLGSTNISGLLLAHYLNVGWRLGLSPNRYFETKAYIERNADIRNVDPFKHYLFTGYSEGRTPSLQYSFEIYAARYAISTRSPHSPLAHFLYNNTGNEGLLRDTCSSPALTDSPPTLIDELKQSHSRGEGYEKPQLDHLSKDELRASLIAFYLPQFHPIPENDRWWGQGFTEWSNTVRGVPRFVGHYQPHLAGDLGYYDLRQDDVMSKQVELAQRAGVAGFCFYYYNFNTTRLLEKPLERFLKRKELDTGFCLMWANENWTRRWDGLDSEILISQEYLKKNDAALIDDIGKHFADIRYIRINNRPIFFIYRPGIIPNAKERISRWRKLFKQRCGEEPLLYMALGFGDHDPALFGLDGAVEFPPHKLAADLPPVNNSLQLLDPDFSGTYFAYDDLVASSLGVEKPEFPLIRTAVPAWDNEARRPGKGMGFVGSTPAKYEHWLSRLIDYATNNPVGDNKPLVFINAWNEWAEGTHLEPDLRWGHAYLNATRRAVTGLSEISDISIDR
ncbi:MAG: glycoside hydrolase family 99-like domain-containing protein, partial [Nitrospira sp.]|nr:glycoside hydrolase family 99-like domain-containing protein [Nitrospira sp.]